MTITVVVEHEERRKKVVIKEAADLKSECTNKFGISADMNISVRHGLGQPMGS